MWFFSHLNFKIHFYVEYYNFSEEGSQIFNSLPKPGHVLSQHSSDLVDSWALGCIHFLIEINLKELHDCDTLPLWSRIPLITNLVLVALSSNEGKFLETQYFPQQSKEHRINTKPKELRTPKVIKRINPTLTEALASVWVFSYLPKPFNCLCSLAEIIMDSKDNRWGLGVRNMWKEPSQFGSIG